MKKVTLILSALALVLGLSQCKKQEEPVQNGEKQHVVLTASNGNDGSKVAVGVSGNLLNLTWEGNETITVSGGASGTLTFKSGEGFPNATFEGDITIDGGGDIVFTVGSEPNFKGQNGSGGCNTTWIKNNIYLVGTSDYQPSGNYDVTMELQYAVLLLDLGEFNRDVKAPATVTISTGGVEIASVNNVTTTSNRVLVAIPTDGTEKTYIFSSDKGKTATKTWTLLPNVFYTKDDGHGAGTGNAIVIEPDAPATPKFSVSAATKVEFAPGNLYYDGSSWKFEANQWSFANTWNPTHVSHFFWSKTESVAYASSYSDSGASTGDEFFTNKDGFTVNGETGWRTLSQTEWDYLLNSRTHAFDLRAWKELDEGTHKGLVILPDGTDASVMNSISSTSDLAKYGAVFLPAAGSRQLANVNQVGSMGFYWSSTSHSAEVDKACGVYFKSGTVSMLGTVDRGYGYSVRLVSEN